MGRKKLEIVTGLIVTLAGGIALYFLLVTSVFKTTPHYQLFLDYTFSGAIKSGAAVKVSGIEIGSVDSIQFMGGKPNKAGIPILTRLTIDIKTKNQTVLRKGSRFIITTAGLLGEHYIEVIPGQWDQKIIPPKTILMGEAPPQLNLMLHKGDQLLTKTIKLMNKYEGNIDRLLKDGGEIAGLTATLLRENQSSITGSLGKTEQLLDKTLILLTKTDDIIGDGKNIKRILSRTGRITGIISRRLNPLLSSVDQALGTTQGLLLETEKLMKKYDPVIDGLLTDGGGLLKRGDRIAKIGEEMLTDINAGKGNIGKVLKGSDLYYDVKELLKVLTEKPWKLLWRGE